MTVLDNAHSIHFSLSPGSSYNGYHNKDAYPFGDSFVASLSPHQAIDNLEYHLVNHKPPPPRTTSTTSSHSSNHNHHHPVMCSSSVGGRRKTMSSDDETDDHEYYNDFQRELQPLNHRAETTV